MRIVLAGSRKLDFLPAPVLSMLEDFLAQEAAFLIGDATGVDTTFQKYFLKRNYSRVEIFSSAGHVRNNVGRWPERQIETTLKSVSKASHAFKDREMCALADIGIMIWDQKSAGTLSNAIDLLEQGKTCWIYNAMDQELVRFESIEELNKWLVPHSMVTREAQNRLRRFRNRMKIGAPLDSLQSELF
jgi:hypothetical protein